MAENCYAVSENKPPSNHICLVDVAGTLNLLTHSAVIISFLCEEIVSYRIVYNNVITIENVLKVLA